MYKNKPEVKLLDKLAEAIGLVRGFLKTHGFNLEDIIEKTGFDKNRSIADAKEAINENDETRKRFEIMARESRLCAYIQDLQYGKSADYASA
jgi:type I restriction enzyme R subunit